MRAAHLAMLSGELKVCSRCPRTVSISETAASDRVDSKLLAWRSGAVPEGGDTKPPMPPIACVASSRLPQEPAELLRLWTLARRCSMLEPNIGPATSSISDATTASERLFLGEQND
jgi:hypothetical protein